MKVAMLAVGSTGDVRPCILISRELIKRGHSVKIIADGRFEKAIIDEGAEFADFPIKADKMLRIATNPDIGTFKMLRLTKKYIGSCKDDIEKILLDNFKGVDVVLYTTSGSSMAAYIAEKYTIPYVRMNYYPDMACSELTQGIFPNLPLPSPLKKMYNFITNFFYYYFSAAIYKGTLRSWIKKYNLTDMKFPYKRGDGTPLHQLMAFSESVIPRPKAYGENVEICGYIFEDKSKIADFTPDEKLKEFLAAGPTPVYIGFGSMSEGSFSELYETVSEALKMTGKRAIISKGWGGLSSEKPSDSIYVVDYYPHDWLFEQVSAIVHHGGAGTTAAGLKAGKPTLIVPFGGDQIFYGKYIHKIGCGPKHIMRKKLTAKKLAKALIEMDSPEMQQNVRNIADKISKENGVVNACNFLEKTASEGWK